MDNITIKTDAGREITLGNHPWNSDEKAIITTKDLDCHNMVSTGLLKDEVVTLIKGLVEVSGIPFETIEEALKPEKFYYILPLIFSARSSERYLNVDAQTSAVAFLGPTETLHVKTKFTEEEYQSLVNDHPELSVLIKEEI